MKILFSIVAVVGAAILWVYYARYLSQFVDRFHTVLVDSPPLDHYRFDSGTLELGRMRLELMTPQFAWSGGVVITPSGRVTRTIDGQTFAFGPGESIPNRSGLKDYRFTPDPGDQVTLTIERSFLSWPTPFETNFMTGYSPSWRRHAYVRLRWTKRSGAKLDMLWQTDQEYHRSDQRWVPPTIEGIAIGLIRTSITEATALHNAAAEYLSRTKQWNRSDYRLEDRGPSPDGTEEILFALHRDDEKSAAPGAGRSVELRVNYTSGRVTREIGGQ